VFVKNARKIKISASQLISNMICINHEHNKKFGLFKFHSGDGKFNLNSLRGYSLKIFNAQTAHVSDFIVLWCVCFGLSLSLSFGSIKSGSNWTGTAWTVRHLVLGWFVQSKRFAIYESVFIVLVNKLRCFITLFYRKLLCLNLHRSSNIHLICCFEFCTLIE